MTRRLTGEERDAILRLRAEGRSNPEIAAAVGRPVGTVKSVLWAAGVGGGTPRGPYRNSSPDARVARWEAAPLTAPSSPRAFSWERGQ